MYENRTMKPVGIALGKGEGGKRRKKEGMNLIKIDCK
jgi:hypothetical protein